MDLSGAEVSFGSQQSLLEGADQEHIEEVHTEYFKMFWFIADYLRTFRKESCIINKILKSSCKFFGMVLSNLICKAEFRGTIYTFKYRDWKRQFSEMENELLD